MILSVENLNSSEQKIVYYQPGGSEMAYLFGCFFLTWWLFLSTTSMLKNNHSEEAKILRDGDADLNKAHKYGTESIVFKCRRGCCSMLQLNSFLFWKGRSHSFTLLPHSFLLVPLSFPPSLLLQPPASGCAVLSSHYFVPSLSDMGLQSKLMQLQAPQKTLL